MPSYNLNALFFEKYFDARPVVIPPCSRLNLNQIFNHALPSRAQSCVLVFKKQIIQFGVTRGNGAHAIGRISSS
jgi:hypothetical protein